MLQVNYTIHKFGVIKIILFFWKKSILKITIFFYFYIF